MIAAQTTLNSIDNRLLVRPVAARLANPRPDGPAVGCRVKFPALLACRKLVGWVTGEACDATRDEDPAGIAQIRGVRVAQFRRRSIK